MCMARKNEMKSLENKTSELAYVAKAVIHALASKDDSNEAYQAAELLDHALAEAEASESAKRSRKSRSEKAKSRSGV